MKVPKILFFLLISICFSNLSRGQQKPVAALFGIDSVNYSKEKANNTVGKPEAKPFDIPVNDAKEPLDKNNKSLKPEPSPTGGGDPKK